MGIIGSHVDLTSRVAGYQVNQLPDSCDPNGISWRGLRELSITEGYGHTLAAWEGKILALMRSWSAWRQRKPDVALLQRPSKEANDVVRLGHVHQPLTVVLNGLVAHPKQLCNLPR
jgi:hypothetical protein